MRWLPIAVSALLLGGCGAEDKKPAQPADKTSHTKASETTPQAAQTNEQKIRAAFRSYNAAVVERDAAAACRYLAPETVAKQRANLKKILPRVPEGCEGSTRALYQALSQNETQAKMLKRISQTAKIDKLKVVGDSAIIDWSARYNGKRIPISQSARKINGSWKLVDVSN